MHPRIARALPRVAAAVLVLTIAAALGATAAPAACNTISRLLGCTESAPAPAPDPGGQESPDQPVPQPGKAFGFSNGLVPAGETTPARAVQALAAAGATHQRLHLSWRTWESGGASTPARPVPSDFSSSLGSAPASSAIHQYDEQYLALRRSSPAIVPIINIGSAPLWATKYARCPDGLYRATHASRCPDTPGNRYYQKAMYPVPAFFDHYRRFVAAVAGRYPAAVIEGNNEPDYYFTINDHGRIDAGRAAEIQCQLHQAVRSVSASRKILSSALYVPSYYRPFIASARQCYDGFSFHTFPAIDGYGAGSILATNLRDLRNARTAHGDTKPIWITETGYSPSSASKESASVGALRRLYNRLMTMPDVVAVLFHTLRDAPLPGENTARTGEDNFGFINRDWTPKARFCDLVARHDGRQAGCAAAAARRR